MTISATFQALVLSNLRPFVICSMASLLAKFRIDYSDLKVIPDITKKPLETTVSFFESLISEFKQPEGIADSGSSSDPSKLWKSHYI
jgi:hypothetical protein